MMRALWFGLAALVFVMVVAAVIVVAVVAMPSSSASSMLASGRSVQVHSDSLWLICSFGHDTATIQTGGKTIVVAPTAVVVNGQPVAPLDGAARNVVVTAEDGDIKLVADGQQVPIRR